MIYVLLLYDIIKLCMNVKSLSNVNKSSKRYNLRPRKGPSTNQTKKFIKKKSINVHKNKTIDNIMHQKMRSKHDVCHKIYELRNRIINVGKNNDIDFEQTISKSTKRNREEFEKEVNNDNNNDNDVSEIDTFTWKEFNKLVIPVSQNDSIVPNDWVSATRVKNYLLKDTVMDWLELYYSKLGFNDDKVPVNNIPNKKRKISSDDKSLEQKNQNLFFEMGNEFERKVIEHLRQNYPTKIKRVVNSYVNESDNIITLKYMSEGVEIIEQAALYNYSNKTFGVADLLIRSDFINKLFTDEVIPKNMENYKAKNLNGNYHYVVIDIKWTTMHLCANEKTIRNSDRFPSYKGQLAIYNAALGQLQGYTPDSAYILAKSWVIDSVKNKSEGHNCFVRLGHIMYDDFDNKYIKHTFDAISWIRNVRHNGAMWSCLEPSVPELYPNMCNKLDNPYHSIKKDLASQMSELTEIWMVGPKNREIAHKKHIYSWKNKKCSAANLGIHGHKVGPVVDKIIKINRDSKNLIEPLKLTNNENDWQTETALDLYVDFETLSGTLYDNINILNAKSFNPFLFMIGVGYILNGEWNYTVFTANDVTLKEEEKILNEFASFIDAHVKKYGNKKNKFPKIYHWSHAEKSNMATLNKRHNKKWLNNVVWCDMHKLFFEVPIVIKGVKKFSLKEVAKVMKEHNMIESEWIDSGVDNGLTAMLEAINYYKSSKTCNMMNNIINYNELDCKIVWEIVRYLRENRI